MRKRKNKKELLTNLIQKFKQTKGFVLFSLLNLEASSLNNLRIKVKEVGDLIEVPKKTILYKANPNFPFLDEELKEPFAILWLYNDDLLSLKVLKDFKEENVEIKILGGVLEESKLLPQNIWELANLPGKDILRAKLLSALSSPLFRLQFTLNSPIKNLLLVLSAIKK